MPPGHGKAATHSRNLRRRKKKTYDKLAAEVDDDTNPNSIPINTPLQVQAISEPVESTPPDGEQSFMMSSLSNKNKRRGFKAAMASTRPQKIIFADHSSPGPKTLPYFEGPSTVPSVAATTSRLISPSQKQEKGLIPRNMFITSVDVEEHLPPTAKRRKRTHDYVSNDETNETSSGLVKKSDVQTVDLIEPGLASTSQSWGEENWQKGSKVETRSQVEVGKYLGWKVWSRR